MRANIASSIRQSSKMLSLTGGALSVSVLNQGFSSGLNFGIGVFLVKMLSAGQFGQYGIGYAGILLFAGVCNALFTTQMVVHLPEFDSSERLKRAGRILLLLIAFCVIASATVLGVVAILSAVKPGLRTELILPTVFGSTGYALKEFFVRLSYSERKERVSLSINIWSAIAVACGFVVIGSIDALWSAQSALWVLAASLWVGALRGIVAIRLPMSRWSLDDIQREGRESLSGGKWSLAGAVVIWLQCQAHVYLTALLLGTAAVGAINAARLFIAPFLFLSPAVGQLLLPRLATLRLANSQSVLRGARIYTVSMAVLAGSYAVMLWSAYEFLEVLLVDGKYNHIYPIVWAWVGVVFCQVLREGASIALQALKQFKTIYKENRISAAVACLMVVWLAQRLGEVGAVSALLVGELLLGALLWKRLRNLSHG